MLHLSERCRRGAFGGRRQDKKRAETPIRLALARSAIKDELSILSNSFQLVSGKIHYHPASSLTAGKLGESSGLRIEALISSAGTAFILQNIRPKVESARKRNEPQAMENATDTRSRAMGREYPLIVWARVPPVIVRPERLLACLHHSLEEMAAELPFHFRIR